MIRSFITFVLDIYQMRSTILTLAKRDFQQQYKSSLLGIVWVFLQPLLFISVLYTVFELGLRAGRDVDMPFSLYLIAGIISWQFFSGLLSSVTGVVKSYAFLVKKVDFRLSVLPIIKLLSALVPQIFLITVAIGLAWIQGYAPGLHTIQLLYYLLAMSALLIGIGWITSSTSIFVNDGTKF